MTLEEKRMIERTIALEGGYVHDLDDPGGETKFGISKRSHPQVDIKKLTIDEAVEIYYRNYLRPLNLPTTLPLEYRWKIFDIAVNQGPAQAVRIYNATKDNPEDYLRVVKLQMQRYVSIVQARPSSQKFLKGWTNRAFERLT